MTTTLRPTGPIKVRKGTDWFGRTVWRWTCTEHPRSRGVHHLNRWTDRRLAERDKADAHPWRRCQDGAVAHFHRFHATECRCSAGRTTPC